MAVTGAGGYVGLNLLPLLLDRGDEVVAVDVRPPAHASPCGASGAAPRWVAADVLDGAAMERALAGVEVVYHLAAVITLARAHETAWRVNTQGLATTARAALRCGVRRFVHCGSVHAFDERVPVLDETSTRSVDPRLPIYDRSKWEGERLLAEVVADGLDAVMANPTGIYGPRDYGLTRLNGVVRDAARGRMPVVIEGGFDLVDVRDVAAGLILAGERGRTGENYLLPGTLLPILELCRRAAAATGARPARYAIPMRMARRLAPLGAPVARLFGSDVLSSAALAALAACPRVDGAKARAELGYTSRPAEETIADLVAFLHESGQLRARNLSRRF